MGIKIRKTYPIESKMPKLTPEGQVMIAQIIVQGILLIIKQFKKRRNVPTKKQTEQKFNETE